MKCIICNICALMCSMVLNAQADSLYQVQQKQIQKLEQSFQKVSSDNGALKQTQQTQEIEIERQSGELDSLRNIVRLNAQNIKITADQLGVKIDETKDSLKSKADSNDLQTKALWGICLFGLFLIVSVIIYYLFHKRINKGNADIIVLKQKADKLNEDILNQFSVEMVEIRKITASLTSLSSVQTSSVDSPDHSLIKTLADRITFMEMTLCKMDKDIRGYKQLSKSIAQMKDNLKANGYELVDMLNKPYNDGMRVTANFIENDDLKEGEQIITGIIKPQINYKGVMIQSAQITVSQNI